MVLKSREFILWARAVLAAFAVAFSATTADAALTISTAATRDVNCTGGVCTATRVSAVLNVSSLASMLAGSNVKIVPGSKALDIVFSASLNWASANSLTLDAYRSITINLPIADSGPGALSLTTNDGGTGGVLSFGVKGNVGFLGLTNALVINGVPYVLVNSIQSLAAAVAANAYANYAFANDYNAQADGAYNAVPVASIEGTFEGLGHTISNFTVDSTAQNGGGALINFALAINDFHMTNADINVTGQGAGATIAGGADSFYGDSASGKVTVGASPSNGPPTLAGGMAISGGVIVNCSSSVVVKGGAGAWAGGLVAEVESGNFVSGLIENSHATGAVTVGTSPNGSPVGGLVAFTDTSIDNSYATGKVTGGNLGYVGGLVGETSGGAITNSHARGAVIAGATANAGGLVGLDFTVNISSSYATGSVMAGDSSLVGGLVGRTEDATLTGSYATGAVSAGNYSQVGGFMGEIESLSSITSSYATGATKGLNNSSVGGLIGYDEESQDFAPKTQNTYAMGAVSTGSNGYVGGLIGYMTAPDSISPPVLSSYSTGAVTGGAASDIGGFVGFAESSNESMVHDYWDTTTSGITNLSQGAGDGANWPGIAGLTTTQFQSRLPAGFNSRTWGESASINGGLPYLLSLPPGDRQMRDAHPDVSSPLSR